MNAIVPYLALVRSVERIITSTAAARLSNKRVGSDPQFGFSRTRHKGCLLMVRKLNEAHCLGDRWLRLC
jgi:hypothetical protein